MKVAGSGHSFTECALTDGVMVHLEGLDRVLDADGDQVKVQAGIVLRDLSPALAERGRAQENLGDIDKQTLAGAISTATHGTGVTLRNISAQVTGLELVTGAGEVVELTAEEDPDGLLAARVSLGALGVISAVTLRTVPAFNLHRVDRVRDLDDVLGSLDRDVRENDHYEFFVFPYAENACTISRNRTDAPARPRGRLTQTVSEVILGYYLAEGLFRLTRRFHGLIPVFNRRAARWSRRATTWTAASVSSPASAASASPRWSTRSRSSTAPRRCEGCSSGSPANATRWRSRSSAGWWPPTTRC